MFKTLVYSLLTMILLSSLSTAIAAPDNQDEFARMRRMMATSPRLAQKLEDAGQFDKSRQLLQELATTVEQVETIPRKIYSPHAFGLYAQFLERRGDTAQAMQWYEKIASTPVNSHANMVKAENMQRYASLLRSGGKKTKAASLDAQATDLIKTQKKLNATGNDY